MSAETLTHLNTQTLIGMTDQRGHAWHYRASEQGDESNHYPGPIPVDDVERRLFHWTPVLADIQLNAITDEGVTTFQDPTRVAVVRPDTGVTLGIFKKASYELHPYQEWLIEEVKRLTDGLVIGSAGLLQEGGQAWVQFELEQTQFVNDVAFRPFLTAATSMNGTLATTYQVGNQIVVCDNTMAAALNEDTARVKIYHTKNSKARMAEVGSTLGFVQSVGARFEDLVSTLTAEKVSDERFDRWASAYSGLTKLFDDDKASKRAVTFAEERKAALIQLWREDERAAQWRGTAFGVLAAGNTFEHHFRSATDRVAANQTRIMQGKVQAMDTNILQVLATV